MVLLSGKHAAEHILESKRESIKKYAPHIGVVQVGDNPASRIYIQNKIHIAQKYGIRVDLFSYPESITTEELVTHIHQHNASSLHGYIVQLPLPKHINEQKIIEIIHPSKDIDGFHPYNIGCSRSKQPGFIAATARGVFELLQHYSISLQGKHVVIVGRSDHVGKPIASLALEKNATVTHCHSHTTNLQLFTKQADILIVAIGKPHFITGSYIKPGATVIDIGIHKTDIGITGDCDTKSVMQYASALTPVPGGVGPMTICALLLNGLDAAIAHHRQSNT